MDDVEFETRSVRMARKVLMTVQAPAEDVERIMQVVIGVTPLSMNAFDQNSYQTAPGIERYRPCEGAVTGAETAVRKRPGVVEVSFELPDDPGLIEQVIETIFQVHSYQEPVIRLSTMLAAQSKGLDEKRQSQSLVEHHRRLGRCQPGSHGRISGSASASAQAARSKAANFSVVTKKRFTEPVGPSL